jgi:hypothetical protein
VVREHERPVRDRQRQPEAATPSMIYAGL